MGQTPNPDYAATIPHLLFMVYQGMFCIITPALISGAFAERMRFSAYLVFICALGDCRLRPARALGVGRRLATRVGALDFAGGTVVHVNSGFAALVAALVVGKRRS